jgi:hypothetical protein
VTILHVQGHRLAKVTDGRARRRHGRTLVFQGRLGPSSLSEKQVGQSPASLYEVRCELGGPAICEDRTLVIAGILKRQAKIEVNVSDIRPHGDRALEPYNGIRGAP